MRKIYWPAFWHRFLSLISSPYVICFYAGMLYMLALIWFAGYAPH